jgi:hypothetical protein
MVSEYQRGTCTHQAEMYGVRARVGRQQIKSSEPDCNPGFPDRNTDP